VPGPVAGPDSPAVGSPPAGLLDRPVVGTPEVAEPDSPVVGSPWVGMLDSPVAGTPEVAGPDSPAAGYPGLVLDQAAWACPAVLVE